MTLRAFEGLRENSLRKGDHETFFLSAGPVDGQVMIFVHGWPELSATWAPLLRHFGAQGYHAVAPDLRGYGRSSIYRELSAYRQEAIVGDMLALADALDSTSAIWIGHDWGAPVVWNMASHHPDRTAGVVGLTVPYRTVERGARAMLHLVDRETYPETDYPYGPWEYQRFYHQHFARATRVLEAAPERTLKALYRRGDPQAIGRPTGHAGIFAAGGWFNGAEAAPDMPRDEAMISAEDLAFAAASFGRTGFFGPNAFYMNDGANLAYSDRVCRGGRLDMPVLFIGGTMDITCEIDRSQLAAPMRHYCTDLTLAMIESGHWMLHERPGEVAAIITRWMHRTVFPNDADGVTPRDGAGAPRSRRQA